MKAELTIDDCVTDVLGDSCKVGTSVVDETGVSVVTEGNGTVHTL